MIRLEAVSKVFRTPRGAVKGLDEVNLTVEEGAFVTVQGPSGSGKTTLLLTVGGMLRPTAGAVHIGGETVYGLTAQARARFRARNIGFVFQMYHLVPYLSVLENILLATGDSAMKERRREALALLERFRLERRLEHKPSELSSGERQRTAMARALLGRPRLILADEPTGNLDPENAEEVVTYLAEFQQQGGTVLVVTHGTLTDRHATRIVRLEEGRLSEKE
jgi:putative ABC transport system ATP-binding protein